MAEMVIGQATSTACAEAPNYEAIYSATEKSLGGLKSQTHDIMGSAAADKALMRKATSFEQSELLNQWQNQISDIQKAETEAMRKSGFAASGVLEQEFGVAEERKREEYEYGKESQQMELQKAIRQSDAATQSSLHAIESQLMALGTSYAAATGYEYKEGGAPVEEIGCVTGQPKRDPNY